MFTHNFSPILFDLGFFSLRWYSLAYIIGIIFGWWYGKKMIIQKFYPTDTEINKKFDDLITYIIFAIIIGGRVGYVIFYNLEFYFYNPIDIIKIWEGGMSFHGALIGIIIVTYIFSIKKNLKTLFLLDVIACVAPVGIFFGRVANFINGELVGKVSNVPWSVIFPLVDMFPRHPSQIYEAILEGIILFIILNIIIHRKKYLSGTCSYLFLILYGVFRIFSEIFREPDPQIGYFLGFLSLGMILSFFMIFFGLIIYHYIKKRDEIR
jgi:phosphatidylglycerol:prolipoprotein diacylglycerol transferase